MSDPAPTDESWVLLVETSAGYEADLLESLLDGADVPVLRKGPESGIFGPGFAGASPLGVKLYVPGSRLAEARDVIDESE